VRARGGETFVRTFLCATVCRIAVVLGRDGGVTVGLLVDRGEVRSNIVDDRRL
jgi:hypothetical protein